MKKILNIFFIAIVLCGGIIGITHACSSNQIDIGNGNCETAKFTITTTNLNAGDEFNFYMSASGTFYVDCGDGGTLSGTGVTNNTITRNDTTEALYTCTYSTAGAKTIKMAGLATGYTATKNIAAIRFGAQDGSINPALVVAISGSIGKIMPTLGLNDDQKPQFFVTFLGTKITSVPATLFSDVTTARPYMFNGTFAHCNLLTNIPENLFSGINGTATLMFFSTFAYSGITSIPENLFINTSFGATELSADVHAVFQSTFSHCSSLTSIPSGLFRNIHIGNMYMFDGTFANCTALTSLPEELFSNITDAGGQEFRHTFNGCTGLSGFVPPSMFSGLIANNSPYTDLYGGFMRDIFNNTNLATTCPSGMTQYITGYEDYWNGKVSCVNANLTCSAGNYLPAHGYECAQCTANNYCVGGTYPYSATESHGITPCDTGYSSAAGASSCTGNVINITWEDATPESVAANNAGSCTYGGTINTPAVAPSKRGYVFTGWSFDTLGN